MADWLKFDLKGMIVGVILLLAHILCIILWIAGW